MSKSDAARVEGCGWCKEEKKESLGAVMTVMNQRMIANKAGETHEGFWTRRIMMMMLKVGEFITLLLLFYFFMASTNHRGWIMKLGLWGRGEFSNLCIPLLRDIFMYLPFFWWWSFVGNNMLCMCKVMASSPEFHSSWRSSNEARNQEDPVESVDFIGEYVVHDRGWGQTGDTYVVRQERAAFYYWKIRSRTYIRHHCTHFYVGRSKIKSRLIDAVCASPWYDKTYVHTVTQTLLMNPVISKKPSHIEVSGDAP